MAGQFAYELTIPTAEEIDAATRQARRIRNQELRRLAAAGFTWTASTFTRLVRPDARQQARPAG